MSMHIGTGGDSPGIMRVEPDRDPEKVLSFSPEYSVYALGVSPAGTKIISGMRVRRGGRRYGRVVLWSHEDGGPTDDPDLDCFQPAPVTAVELIEDEATPRSEADGTALTGGTDGTVRKWSTEDPDAPVGEWEAHDGPVVALRALHPKVAATLAVGEPLRLWNVETGEEIAASDLSGEGGEATFLDIEPIFGAHLSQDQIRSSILGILALNGSGEIRSHPFGIHEGTVHRRDGDNTLRPLTTDQASSFALNGRRLYLATAQSREIISYALQVNPPGERWEATESFAVDEIDRASCDKSVFRLEVLRGQTLVVVYETGEVEIWSGGNLEPMRELDIEDARSVAGPHVHHRDQEWRRGVAASIDNVLQAERYQEVIDRLNTLAPVGLRPSEHRYLLMRWGHEQGDRLTEIQMRRQFVQALERVPENASQFYALGRLLESINELDRARRYYDAAIDCDPEFRDAKARTEELPSDSRTDPSDTIYDSFESLSEAAWHLRKATLFDDAWTHPITVRRRREDFGAEQVPSLDAVREEMDDPQWQLQTRPFRTEEGFEEKSVLMYYGPVIPDGWGVAFCLEPFSESYHTLVRVLVLPGDGQGNDTVGPGEILNRLHKADNLHWNSVEWFEEICQTLDSAVGNAFEAMKEERRQNYF